MTGAEPAPAGAEGEWTSLDREEFSAGLACVGSPILVHGKAVAAVAAMGRSLDGILPHTEVVQHTAEVISHVLSRGV